MLKIFFTLKKKNKEVTKMNKNDLLEKNYNGLLVVRAKNALFNAGFDGLPRTLPDGTIFATDKALKYCLREYLNNFEENSKVFVKRNRHLKKKEYVYETLAENYWDKTGEELKNETTDEDIIKKLKEFIDIRLFGIVFSPKKPNKNISFTGPVQISYGINKLQNAQPYSCDILSPYAPEKDEKKKDPNKKEKAQTTLGNESRVDEVFYVYDISVNKNNARGTNGTGMLQKDLDPLKKALMNGPDLITSTTKFGVESSALIWLENQDNKNFNNLSDYVSISKINDQTIIDASKLKKHLEGQGIQENSVEKKVKREDIEIRWNNNGK